jgi:hypothetical protein
MKTKGDLATCWRCSRLRGAQSLAGQWVRGRTAVLEATDVQERVQRRSTSSDARKAMAIRQEHYRGVPVTPTVVLNRLDQPPDLAFS